MSLVARALDRYPSSAGRAVYLALAVAVAVMLAWLTAVAGGVAPQIMAEYGMSFRYYVAVAILAVAVGATGAAFAGLADKVGRANIAIGGLLTTSLLVLFAIPHAADKVTYLVLTSVAGVLEGATGVAVPALIRDFSPQQRRATAMGLWSLGPVLGALLVTEIASHTLDSHPDWRFQFRVCGAAGLIVTLVAAVGLRELSAPLRNQVMVRAEDREVLELRASELTAAAPQRTRWRAVAHRRLVVASLGISVYLIFYYVLVGFFVVFLVTNFHFSGSRSNGLANWYWWATAAAMVAGGLLSDRLRVRKPFMVCGALISATGAGLLAEQSTNAYPAYRTLVVIVVLCALGNGLVFTTWMTAYTETLERRAPGASAAGIALWSLVNKTVVTAVLVVFTLAVTAPTLLVDDGPKVATLASRYASELAASAQGDDTALARIPAADLAYLRSHAPEVQRAEVHGPAEWRAWWWVSVAGQLVFLVSVFALDGRWRPRRAREDLVAHDREVSAALRGLRRSPAAGATVSGAPQ